VAETDSGSMLASYSIEKEVGGGVQRCRLHSVEQLC